MSGRWRWDEVDASPVLGSLSDVRPYLSHIGLTYFCVTAPMAKPPLALWTATEVKGPGTKNCPVNLPPPAGASDPIGAPVMALNTRMKAALASELVASILNCDLLTTYSVFVMVTVSVPLRTLTMLDAVVPW